MSSKVRFGCNLYICFDFRSKQQCMSCSLYNYTSESPQSAYILHSTTTKTCHEKSYVQCLRMISYYPEIILTFIPTHFLAIFSRLLLPGMGHLASVWERGHPYLSFSIVVKSYLTTVSWGNSWSFLRLWQRKWSLLGIYQLIRLSSDYSR